MKQISLVLALLSCFSTIAYSRDSIFIDIEVNDQPARMIFDTGSSASVLFSPAAKRLKLKVAEPDAGRNVAAGKINLGFTELCKINIWNKNVEETFGVLNAARIAWGADGFIGWRPVRNNILRIDMANRVLTQFTIIPEDVIKWQRLPISKNSSTLSLEFPRPGGGIGRILVDTGAEDQVSLAPHVWEKWKKGHPKDPVTLVSYYMPGAGWVVSEVMWAKEIMLGPFKLKNVQIRNANIGEIESGQGGIFEGSLTVAALKQISLLVDGIGGYAYWASKENSKIELPQNRAGAVFAALDPNVGGDMIAHVVPGGPAAEAGIKDGDIVVRVNSLDVKNWGDDAESLFVWLTSKPAGSRIFLVIKRDGQEFEMVITLKEMFEPDAKVFDADDFLRIRVEILGEPLQMSFHSADRDSALYRATAERLQLKILKVKPDKTESDETQADPRNSTGVDWTADYTLNLLGSSVKRGMYVVDVPDFISKKLDGSFGWGDLKTNIMVLNAASRSVWWLKELPPETATWHKLPLRKDSDSIILEGSLENGQKGAFLIDTGSNGEVELSPTIWKKWKEDHPNDPVTLTSVYSHKDGMVVNEIMWAKSLSVGPFKFTNITIREAMPDDVESVGAEFQMVLSLEALGQMDFIVDGKGGFAYWINRKGIGIPPQNRSGMIIAPLKQDSEYLTAHVVKGSPAEEAGVRTGDAVLKINSKDMTKWKTDEDTIKFSPLTEQPAGAKITLLLRRDGKDFEAMITLRDIFEQSVPLKP